MCVCGGVAIEFAAEDVRGRIVVRPGRMRPVPGPRIRARHAPAFMIRLTRRRDMTMPACPGACLIFLPHRSCRCRATRAPRHPHGGVDAFGLGVSEHPAVGRLGNAQDPALRRYRAAAGVGPYGLCFRANTGAACSETSTSISNWRLRPLNAISSFRSGVRLSAALVEPLLRTPAPTGAGWNARCRTPS